MSDNSYKEKVKAVFVPVLKIAFCVTLVYLIFYAICINELELRIKEDLAIVFIPLGLAGGATLLARKYIKQLTFKKDWYRFYYFIVTFWFWALLFFPVKWFDAATHPLVSINNAIEINGHPGAIYFRLPRLKTAPNIALSTYTITESHGKRSTTTHLNIYYVTPVVIGSNSAKSYWICKKYHTSTGSRKDKIEMNRQFNDYAEYADSDFKRRDFVNSPCYERLRYSEERIRAVEAIHKMLPQMDEKNIVILEPQSKLPGENKGTFLKGIIISLCVGVILQLVLLALAEPKLKPLKGKTTKSKFLNPAIKKPVLGFRLPFKENKNHIVTLVLMLINIIMFIVMIFGGVDVMSPFAPDLLKFGALSLDTVNGGEWWRITTSLFLHGGIVHLVANMFNLMLIGLITEQYIGRLKYTTIYFLSGIVGNVISLWFNPYGVCVGASGAIFGLFGAGIVMTLTSKKQRNLLPIIAILGGLGLFAGFITPGVNNSAHIGGLLSGAALLFILQKMRLTKETSKK